MRKAKLSAAVFLVWALAITPVGAANVNLTTNHDSLVGNSRYVSMGGNVTLAGSEQVTDVRIYYYTTQGLEAQVQGTYNPTTKQWAASVGDYQMYEYIAVVTIRSGTQSNTYGSGWFYWTAGR